MKTRPGMEQGLPILEPRPKIQEEGIVLVPLVVSQDHFAPEGDDPRNRPHSAQNEHGQKEGHKIEIARFARAGHKAPQGISPSPPGHSFQRHIVHLLKENRHSQPA